MCHVLVVIICTHCAILVIWRQECLNHWRCLFGYYNPWSFFFLLFFQFHIRHLLKSLGPNKDLSLDISFEVLYLFDNYHLLNFTMYYDYVSAKNIFLKHFSNFCKYVSRKCVYCCFTKNIHQLKNIFTKIIYFILKNK